MKEILRRNEPIIFESISGGYLAAKVKDAIARHHEEVERIAKRSDTPDFDNTVAALERSGEALDEAVLMLSNLESALGSVDLMEAMTEITPLLSSHSADVLLNERLWRRIKAVKENPGHSLSQEDERLLDETWRDFAESGAELDEDQKARYREITSRISQLNVLFGQNVVNDMKSGSRKLWLKENQLEGLPDDIKKAAAAEAEAAGRPGEWLFTVFYPSYAPFMKFQADRSLREALYRMYATRNVGGEFDNTAIMLEIANLRLELARLFGYKSYADYSLRRSMAGSRSAVMGLLESLRKGYADAMKAELEEIETFARKTEGKDFKLKPWDYSYWANRLKEVSYSFNDNDLKPYFELENTIGGVMGLATRLYGYTFRVLPDAPKYHPDVKVFEVYDREGALMGLFYADFFNREGKSPGAWMTEFRQESRSDDGDKTVPAVSIVCNFTKPSGYNPVLLTAAEVETFLHEFGHALHGLSADTVFASLSGTNVRRDFVELFSQFNENFLTRKEWLDGFARHYKTGEPIPQELLDRFIASSRFGAAYACMRQLGFGFLDMAYHSVDTPIGGNPADFEAKAMEPVKIFDQEPGCLTGAAFGHIFSGGYAAGYYGYKWSEVLDADAFAAFEEEGLFNSDTAGRFRQMMRLGNTVPPQELYRRFRGRDVNIDALLKRDGIRK